MSLLDKLFGPPSRDKFARQVIDALRAAGDARDVQYDAENFRLTFRGPREGHGTSHLTNLYAEHCRVPLSGRKQHLKHIVRGLLTYLKQLPDDFDDARPDLRPAVRSRCYLDLMRLHTEVGGDRPPDIPHQLIGSHLAAMLVYDLPESMQSVNQETLDDWGVSFYEAMEAACRNLREIQFAFANIGDSLYASMTGDNYDASRLLLSEFMEQLPCEGPPLAVVANRDTLLVTGRDDDNGMQLLLQLARQTLDNPRPVTGIPVVLEEGEWATWLPPDDHPYFSAFRELETKTLAAEYADQQPLLQALFEKRDENVFVATYSAAQRSGGETFSFCVWSEGVDSLLPRTDKLMLFRPETQRHIAVPWDRAAPVLRGLLQPMDIHPPRYRAREFPSQEQMRELESLAEPDGE